MTPLVERAKEFAEIAHGSQEYGEGVPYSEHLNRVYEVLVDFGITDDRIHAAAFLHDVLEDTATSYNDLKRRFGDEVAELVYAVTDELGRNRMERHKKTYPKIKEHPYAVMLKLADRIANVCYGLEHKQEQNEMYRREHPEFKAALCTPPTLPPGPTTSMWDFLDRLFIGDVYFNGVTGRIMLH